MRLRFAVKVAANIMRHPDNSAEKWDFCDLLSSRPLLCPPFLQLYTFLHYVAFRRSYCLSSSINVRRVHIPANARNLLYSIYIWNSYLHVEQFPPRLRKYPSEPSSIIIEIYAIISCHEISCLEDAYGGTNKERLAKSWYTQPACS